MACPHRRCVEPAEALEMIKGGSGTLFDPEVAGISLVEISRYISTARQDTH